LDAGLQEATAKIDEYARGMISGSGSTLFEELGLYYIGPIDGHNLDLIIAMLQGLPHLLCWSTGVVHSAYKIHTFPRHALLKELMQKSLLRVSALSMCAHDVATWL
jgi:hypothetical protein